jgi:hypothetical protein
MSLPPQRSRCRVSRTGDGEAGYRDPVISRRAQPHFGPGRCGRTSHLLLRFSVGLFSCCSRKCSNWRGGHAALPISVVWGRTAGAGNQQRLLHIRLSCICRVRPHHPMGAGERAHSGACPSESPLRLTWAWRANGRSALDSQGHQAGWPREGGGRHGSYLPEIGSVKNKRPNATDRLRMNAVRAEADRPNQTRICRPAYTCRLSERS